MASLPLDAGRAHLHPAGAPCDHGASVDPCCAQDPASGQWFTFYPNHETYRTRGLDSPLPELARALDPATKVHSAAAAVVVVAAAVAVVVVTAVAQILGGRRDGDFYNNGGEWLDAVHATGPPGSGMLTGYNLKLVLTSANQC